MTSSPARRGARPEIGTVTSSSILLVGASRSEVQALRMTLRPEARIAEAKDMKEADSWSRREHFDATFMSPKLFERSWVAQRRTVSLGAPMPLVQIDEEQFKSYRGPEVGPAAGAPRPVELGRSEESPLDRQTERDESLTQYRTLLRESPDGILILSPNGIVVFANPAAGEAFGIGCDELVGSDLGIPLVGNTVTEIALRNHKTMEMRLAMIPWHGRNSYLVMLRDVTERVRMIDDLATSNEMLEQLTQIDPLTGLLNRRGIESAIIESARTSVRNGSQGSVILIDCDDFKGINELGGYSAGDATLRLIARTILETVRHASDQVGRIGGDEFLVLLPDTSLTESLIVAQKIRTAIESRPLAICGTEGRCCATVSIGVAPVPSDIKALSEIVALAEPCLHASKEAGKNRVTAKNARSDAKLSCDLAQSIVANPKLVRVFAQRVVRVRDGALHSHELLSRGPRSGTIEDADVLFSAARSENVLSAIDLICLRACIEAGNRCLGDGRVHINVLPSTLIEVPREILDEVFSRIAPDRLVLELSEQEFVGDPNLLQGPLERLRSLGIRIALDDVGFGRTSLETMLTIDPDIVKIDRSLIAGIAVDPIRQRIVKRLLGCVSSLDAVVIAEGVESAADAGFIDHIGIPFAQGYLWDMPQPLEVARSGPI